MYINVPKYDAINNQMIVTDYVWHSVKALVFKIMCTNHWRRLWVKIIMDKPSSPRWMPCVDHKPKKGVMNPHTVYTNIANLECFYITERTWEHMDRNSPDLIAHFDMELKVNFTLCCSKLSFDQWHAFSHSKKTNKKTETLQFYIKIQCFRLENTQAPS